MYGFDGNAGPVTCNDGRPSVAAIAYFNRMHLRLTQLGPDASPTDAESAVCADRQAGRTTNQIEQSAFKLVAAEMNWHFPLDAEGIVGANCPP